MRAPCLIAHSTNDDVASLRNARIVQRGVRAPVETLLLDNSYHMITVDQDRSQLIAQSAAFFQQIAERRSLELPCGARVAAAID